MGPHEFKFNAGIFPLPRDANAVVMADPLAERFDVDGDWQQLPDNTLGIDFQVQVTASTPIEIAISASQPSGPLGEVLVPLLFYAVVAADAGVWVRCAPPLRTSQISITGVDISPPLPPDQRDPRFADNTPADVYSLELPTFTATLDTRYGPAHEWWWEVDGTPQDHKTSDEGKYDGFELILTAGTAPVSVTLTCVNKLESGEEKATTSHVAQWLDPLQYAKPAYSSQYA